MEGTEAAEADPGLGGMTASGVWASPGGGRLGGGMEVSMAGLARPAGEGAGGEAAVVACGAVAVARAGAGAAGVGAGAGESSCMGAKVATEVEASLLRAGSLLRDGIVCRSTGDTGRGVVCVLLLGGRGRLRWRTAHER